MTQPRIVQHSFRIESNKRKVIKMKNILFLAMLLLILLIIGCSEDEVVTPPINDNEKLNKRTVELFNQGVEVVEAAITIDREFSFDDNVLLKSLYNAGYSVSDVVKAIHIAYEYNSRLAEPILIEILKNKTEADIAELILSEYADELKTRREDLKYFLQKVVNIESKVQILKNTFKENQKLILIILKEVGDNSTEVIKVLINNFQLTKEDVKILILEAECTASEIADALRTIYNSSASEVFQFLSDNGFPVIQVLNVLKDLYNLSTLQMTQLLEEKDYDVSEITEVLIELQYSYEQIGIVLKDYFHYSAEATTSLLKQLNVNIENIADILIIVYNLTIPVTVEILYEAGFSIEEIIDLLYHHLNLGVQEIIDLLSYFNLDPCVVLNYFNIPC